MNVAGDNRRDLMGLGSIDEGVALKMKPATPLFEDECLAPGGFALKEDEDEWSKQLIGLLLWDEDEDECPVRQEEQI